MAKKLQQAEDFNSWLKKENHEAQDFNDWLGQQTGYVTYYDTTASPDRLRQIAEEKALLRGKTQPQSNMPTTSPITYLSRRNKPQSGNAFDLALGRISKGTTQDTSEEETEKQTTRLAPEMDAPDIYQQNRERLMQYISNKRNAGAVSGSYVMDELLGLEKEKKEPETKESQFPEAEHYNRYNNMSADEVMSEWARYKSNKIVQNDIKDAKTLINITFAGQRGSGYEDIRDSLSSRYGIDAYDADALQGLVDKLESGTVYLPDGSSTTYSDLYMNALNREKAAESALSFEETQHIQSLYSLGIDDLEKMYNEKNAELDDPDSQINSDLNDVQMLINISFPGVRGSGYEDVRDDLSKRYGVDAYDVDELQGLLYTLQNSYSDVLYTDSTGKNYTYQELAYNARNREAFTNLETDRDSFDLISQGYQLYKQIAAYEGLIADDRDATYYRPMISELQGQLDGIADQLGTNGYDFYDMAAYLDTEEGRQRYIMMYNAVSEFTQSGYGNAALANLGRIALMPMQATEWLTNGTGSGDPSDLRNYVPANYYDMFATNYGEAVTQSTSEMIGKDITELCINNGWSSTALSELAQQVYQGKLSWLESRILALGCMATFGPAGEVISLLIMGSAAASSELKKSIDLGYDNTHAVLNAGAAGIAEVLFEKLSLDRFLDSTNGDVYKTVLERLKDSQLQGLVEASEEVFTTMADSITSGIIGKDVSEYNTAIRSLMAGGMSYTEAVRQANYDLLSDILSSAFGGYIGGTGLTNIVMQGAAESTPFSNAISQWRQNREDRQNTNPVLMSLGERILQNQSGQDVIRAAGETKGNDALSELAESVAQQTRAAKETGETRTQRNKRLSDTGKLAAGTYQQNLKESIHEVARDNAVTDYIRDALKAKGQEASDDNVDLVRKFFTEEGQKPELTVAENALAGDIGAEEIAKSVIDNADEIMRTAESERTSAVKRMEGVRTAAGDISDRTSDTGSARNTETDEDIEISEISLIKRDGSDYVMTLKTADGKEVDSDVVAYKDSAQAMLYEAARTAGLNAAVANSMIKSFDGQGSASAYTYMAGMVEGLEYGKTHQTADMVPTTGFFADLTPAQQQAALRLGEIQSNIDTERLQEKVNNIKRLATGARSGSIDVRSDLAGLNDQQRTGIKLLEKLVDLGVLKNNFHFFQSEQGTVNGRKTQVLTEAMGGREKGDVAPNGWYDRNTGDIYIDLNAGDNGEGTILFTAGHELTHFLHDWSPEKFNNLAKFLVEQYHGAGTDVEDMIQRQIAKSGGKLNHDDAFEEFVADAMQIMFTDTDVAEKLAKLRDTDRSLWQKIKDWITEFISEIREVYAKFDPASKEAKTLRTMTDALEKISDMFAEGLSEATESYTLASAENLTEAEIKKLDSMGFTVVNGLIVAKNMADLAEQVVPPGQLNYYSYRTEPEWEKSVLKEYGDNADTWRYINAIKNFTNAMVSDDAVRRIVPMGSYAYSKQGPLRDNVEYVITFDMDTSCPRTFQFLKYRDAIQTYAKRPLTYNESVNLLELMRAFGQNIPCSYCYVENKRVLLSASYNNFFAFRNNVLNEQDAEKAKAQMYGYNEKNGTLAKASQEVFDKWRRDMSYNPTVSDIWEATQTARNSVFNFLDEQLKNGVITTKQAQKKIENFVCDHFGVKGQGPRAEISGIVSEWIYDTHAQQKHTYFLQNNPDVDRVDVRALGLNHEALAYAKSASSAKTVSSYVPYTDQLKNIPQKVKDYVMGMGGIRKHSSNDFRIDYVQDYFMFYADLAAGGWTGHTYTKSTDFVKIFGNTGDRINMSIAMLDGPNGTVRENTLEGMYWKDAKALRNAYKNAGVMSMVTSDAQLSYALNSDWIDMVIPFHASSLDKKVWYDLRHWFDYTTKQLERFYNSTEMELALIQKALDDAGVKYSSDQMNADLIAAAKEAGAGGKSDERTKIMTKEVKRLKSLAAKNGVQFNPKMSTTEIQDLYNSTFGIKQAYGKNGNRIKPHFLPGETVVDGVTIPGHNNDVNKYLELCREYGVHPRFDGVVVQDANGKDVNVIDHDGYIKLIKETARTDSAQEKIQFNFDQYDEYLKMTPMEYAMQQLQDYARIGGYDNLSEDPMGIKKRFIDEYLGQDREIGWFSEDTQDKIDLLNEYQNKENTGDVKDLPVYMDEYRGTTGFKLSSRDLGFGVTVEDIENYVDNAYSKSNKLGYKKYAPVNERLIEDVSDDISDIADYTHALRDNDIRHINNSHGPNTNEKYPVTPEDIKLIPYIVNHYDKVFTKTNAKGQLGLLYVKVFPDNVVYFVEAVTDSYGGEKLLINKQMIKTGIDSIPNVHGYLDAITKKQTESEFLSDLQEVRQAYVRNVSQIQSVENSIEQTSAESQEKNVQPDDTGFLYSRRIIDDETLGFLNGQKTVTVYRAMQEIDGKLYPPMTAYTRDENGKKVMRPAAEIGNWYQSVERPDLIDPKTGKFKLEKGETDAGKGSDVNAAYNPYFHTSLSILNDQFSSAWDRSNMVVVEGEVPVSELTSGYKAQYAKDAVGKTKWHSGPVATELNRFGKPREVILSRYFKPTRVIDNAEAAKSIADTLKGTNISIPENVVSPGLLSELKKIGVNTSGPRGLAQNMVDAHYERTGGPKFSFRDRGDEVTEGVYISDAEFKNNSKFSYKNAITSGLKKGETRFKKDNLLEKAYKTGERIAIVQSGVGGSAAYATTKIGQPEWIPAKDWEKRRKDTRVPKGSAYDLKQGESGKWYYPFVDLHILPKPVKQATNSAYGAKFSDRDYMDAVNTNRLGLAQEMVREAAKEAGYTIEAYHGTRLFGFTKIDTEKNSDDSISFFVTDDKITAKTYTNNATEVRRLNDPGTSLKERMEERERTYDELSDSVDALCKVLDEYAGESGYADPDDIRGNLVYIAEYHDDDMYFSEERDEYINGVLDDLWYTIDKDQSGDYYDWLESDESQKLRDAIDDTVEASGFYYAAFHLEETDHEGLYHVYVNPGNLLEVDGNGEMWNGLRFMPEDIQKIKEKIEAYENKVLGAADRLSRGEDLEPMSDGEYEAWELLKFDYRHRVDEIRQKYHFDVRYEASTRDIAQYAYDNGYDGVVFRNIIDDGGRGKFRVRVPADVYALFKPQQQVKSADPVTYDEDGNVIPLSERFNPENPDIRYSNRDPDSLDTRTLLSNALAETAQDDIERKYIEEYQADIAEMNEQQKKLNELRAEIRKMSFSKGKRDTKKLRTMQEEANKIANRVNIYDKKLLRLESMKPLKNVVDREKKTVETRIRNKMAARMTDYRNRVASKEYITRIEHEVKGLRDRILHPKAKTVIPEAFAKPVADFLSGIDFSTFYKDGTRRPGKANITRDKLRMSLEVLSNSLDEETLLKEYWMLDISPDMKQWIDNLTHSLDQMATGETFVVNQMSPEDLKDLYKTVVAIRAAVNMAGKLYTNMSSNVRDLAVDTIQFLEPLGERERSAFGARVYKTLGWDYAQPVTAFERFGEGGKQIFKGLIKGQKKEAENVQKIRDFAETAYTAEEVNGWQEEMHEVTVGGERVKVPVTYIMELYCLMKDEGARRHIIDGGGIRFDDLIYRSGRKKTTKTFGNAIVTEDEVRAMIGTLTDRQREVADSLQEFIDRVGAEWGNEISMTRFGYHAFGQIANYYPIRTVKQGSEYDAQQKRANIYALLNKSFTKERNENANNAVIVGDIFNTFSNHMSEMAVYNSWALPVIDTIHWFNYRERQDLEEGLPEVSVMDAIRQAYSYKEDTSNTKHNPADEYIRRLLESINSQKSGGLSETLAFKNLRMVNRVAVAGNVRVAIQQPFSITRAFEMLNPKYVWPMSMKTLKAEYAEMVENSSFGRWKGMGYYDVDISRPLEAEILKNTTFADRFTEKTMKLAEWGDQFTWTTLWHGCKLEAQAKGLSGEDAVKAASEKFDDIIVHTQVVDSVLTKSQWMRSDSFWHRMTSAFMSEPMTSYNTLLRRFDQYQRDVAEHGKQYAVSHNWRNIAKTAVVFTLTQAVNALVTAPIDASRDDDDYKTWLEKMLERFKKNFAENMIPTNMMPYIADIVDYMIYGSEDRADLAMYTRLIDAGKQLYNLFDKEKFTAKKAHRTFMTMLTLISSVTGLPLSNMTRDGIAIWNTVIGDVLKVDYGSWKFQTANDTNKSGYEAFVKALSNNDMDRADYVYHQLVSNGVNSKTIEEGARDLIGDMAKNGDSDYMDTLVRYTRYFSDLSDAEAVESAEAIAAWWDYHGNGGTLEPSSFAKYYAEARPAGIDIRTYETYIANRGDFTKKADILPIIDALPITPEQKDVLYFMKGYAESKLHEAPWHN